MIKHYLYRHSTFILFTVLLFDLFDSQAMKKTVGKFVRRKKAEKPRVTDAPETEHKVNHGASKVHNN